MYGAVSCRFEGGLRSGFARLAALQAYCQHRFLDHTISINLLLFELLIRVNPFGREVQGETKKKKGQGEKSFEGIAGWGRRRGEQR